jgi:hypothetical protein
MGQSNDVANRVRQMKRAEFHIEYFGNRLPFFVREPDGPSYLSTRSGPRIRPALSCQLGLVSDGQSAFYSEQLGS